MRVGIAPITKLSKLEGRLPYSLRRDPAEGLIALKQMIDRLQIGEGLGRQRAALVAMHELRNHSRRLRAWFATLSNAPGGARPHVPLIATVEIILEGERHLFFTATRAALSERNVATAPPHVLE